MRTRNAKAGEVIIRLPRFHAAQARIVREARRMNTVCCGRRFGKSVLGIDRIVRPPLAGKFVAYFCPSHKMLAEIWREVRRVLMPVTRSANKTDHRIELITGGIIDMWSLENYDSIRGRKYHRVVVDEAAMCPHLEAAWQEVIRPTLTDYVGDAWFLSTPKGINFFKTVFDRGQDPNFPDWMSWQMPTLANPFILPSEVAAAKAESTSVTFTQEYEAAFLQSEGSVFRNIEACLGAPLDAAPAHHQGHRIVQGVDFAQKHDYTVLCAFCATCMCEVELDRFNKVAWAAVRARLTAQRERWAIDETLAELNSIGSPNIEALQDEDLNIIGFETTASSKSPLIQNLVLAFEREEAQWLNNPVATSELVAYESVINKMTGRVGYSAPSGGFDDSIIARCLALKQAQKSDGIAEHGESLW